MISILLFHLYCALITIEACYSVNQVFATMANTSDKKLATVNAISFFAMADNRSLSRVYTVQKKTTAGRILFPPPDSSQVEQDRGEGSTIIPMLDPSTVLRYSSEMVKRSWRALKLFCAPPTETGQRETEDGEHFESSWKRALSLRTTRTILTFVSSSPKLHSRRPLVYLIPFLKISYPLSLATKGEIMRGYRSGQRLLVFFLFHH